MRYGVYMDVKISHRSIDSAVLEECDRLCVSPLNSAIIAARLQKADIVHDVIEPTINILVPATEFKDGERATMRIADAVTNDEVIGILTDYDVDGITSHAVILKTLRDILKIPKERLHSIIGHRVNDGYGISTTIVDTILKLDPKPDLIVTADMGSSDEPRIALLTAAGIDVVVTDHHALPVDGHPKSAYACINPSRVDCTYPDATIAGCMVAWLTMTQVRARLIAQHSIPATIDTTFGLLSYVALGTIADCVSVGDSVMNRFVVQHGLTLMNRLDRPCWSAIAHVLGEDALPFDADTLGFQLAPRINARSRLDDPYAALHYMDAVTEEEARANLATLNSDNEDRKAIERTMTETALQQIEVQVANDAPILIAFLEDGHPGVQGIVASRITERYGKPSFVLTPTPDPTKLGGSGRSVETVHIRNVMQKVHELDGSIFVKFGGHSGAAGLTLNRERLPQFKQLMVQVLTELLDGRKLVPCKYTDGTLDVRQISLSTLDELNQLAPYGRGFERPTFDNEFVLSDYRLIGKDSTHALLTLRIGDITFKAIWFKCVEEGQAFPFAIKQRLRCVYKLARNTYRGNTTLQLMMEHVSHV